MTKKKTETQASKILGILSIVSSFIIPGAAIAMSIIGLSIKKGNYDRDIALNTVGLVMGLIAFVIYYLYW